MKISKLKKSFLLMVLGAISVSANANLLEWSENFEAANSDWTMNSMWRDTTTAYDGSFSLYNGGANGHYAIRSIGSTVEAFELTFSVYIRGDEGPGGDGETVSYGITSGEVSAEAWDNFQIDLQAYIGDGDNKAYMRAWNGSTAGAGIEVSKQAWHTVNLVVRPDTVNGGTFDWYLDDVLQASNYDFRFDATAETTGFAIWHWASDNSLETFTDSINVQVPEPATVALMGIGFLTMRNRRKISK